MERREDQERKKERKNHPVLTYGMAVLGDIR
jgi:hypothetical protein